MSEFEQIMSPVNDSYLWLDFEFTGLDIQKDVVIEVGAVLTKGLFDIQGEFEAFVHHPEGIVEELMGQNKWWLAEDRSELSTTMKEGVSVSNAQLADVANGLHSFVKKHTGRSGSTYLAGNSIHTDRKWLERDFPATDELLHYRMLDVSALKLIVASTTGIQVIKSENHRALSDVYESMNELKSLLRIIGNGSE